MIAVDRCDLPHHAVTTKTDWIERFAIGASFLCLVHCLALPLLLALLPALSAALPVPETFHIAVLALAIPTSAIALGTGLRRQGDAVPAIAGVVGLALLAIGALVFGETVWETPVTVMGSLALAGAHIANWRLRHGRQH